VGTVGTDAAGPVGEAALGAVPGGCGPGAWRGSGRP